MPNWAVTYYKFCSDDKEQLEKFRSELTEAVKTVYHKSDFGKRWLGNILYHFGLTHNDAVCRGTLEDLDSEVTEENGYYSFLATTESAWSPCVQMWVLIFKKHFPNIQFAFSSEEPGNGLYAKMGCDFFEYPEKYIVDACINDHDAYEYFVTEEEAIAYLKEYFDEVGLKIESTSLSDIEKEVNEKIDKKDFFIIRLFEDVDINAFD